MSAVSEEIKKISRLKDLFLIDLEGWQICYGYFLEIKHELMGIFPAIINSTDESSDNVIFVIEKRLLKKVWDLLEKRPAKVTELLVLANHKLGVAFNLRGFNIEEIKPLRVYTEQEINMLCCNKDPFRWAPGIFCVCPTEYFAPPNFE